MKANELRIGNLVHLDDLNIENGKWVQRIIDITYRDIFNIVNGNDMVKISYEPIPLTEEWLIKFGFEKPAHSWNGKIFHLSEWDEFPNNWMVAMDKNGAVIVLKLKYVHQLQNLYFALTGEELTLINE